MMIISLAFQDISFRFFNFDKFRFYKRTLNFAQLDSAKQFCMGTFARSKVIQGLIYMFVISVSFVCILI